MRHRCCSLIVVVSIASAALTGCDGNDERARPKAGKQVVVTKLPPEFSLRGVAIDGQGTVYTSGWDGKQFVLVVVPKKGKPIFRPIPCATDVGVKEPVGGSMTAAPDGTIFWAMDLQHRIVKMQPDGTGDCYAGTGRAGFSGDGGPALEADLNAVSSLAYEPESQDLYLADSGNGRLRKINASGVIITVAEYRGWSARNGGEEGYVAYDTRRGRLYTEERGRISYRARDGAVTAIANRDVSFEFHGLAPDPSGGELVITAGCRVSRVGDDGAVKVVPGGNARDSQCMYQVAVDAQGNVWVLSGQLVLIGSPPR
jgi:hypothetical protein